MLGGICCWKVGSSFWISSTTSIVLAPGWRWIASTMPRLPLYHGRHLVGLHAVDDLSELGEPHRATRCGRRR
jgi:hypothetical protein